MSEALNYLLIDTVSGRTKNSNFAFTSGGKTDQYFTVGGGGATTFTVTETFTSLDGSTKAIDVFVNGILMRELSTADYLRNTGTNQIVFNYTVPANSLVMVRVFS